MRKWHFYKSNSLYYCWLLSLLRCVCAKNHKWFEWNISLKVQKQKPHCHLCNTRANCVFFSELILTVFMSCRCFSLRLQMNIFGLQLPFTFWTFPQWLQCKARCVKFQQRPITQYFAYCFTTHWLKTCVSFWASHAHKKCTIIKSHDYIYCSFQ